MGEMIVEYLSVADLSVYESNTRTHSDEQVGQVARSIEEFGFTNPILIDSDKVIIAGHGRLLAAKLLGMDAVPTITLRDLSPEQVKAYVIADNQLALNAGWNEELLASELKALADGDFDLSLIGFDDDELAGLLADDVAAGLVDDDDIPDVAEGPISSLGDVWTLGNHRLMCGDSTCADTVEVLMGGAWLTCALPTRPT